MRIFTPVLQNNSFNHDLATAKKSMFRRGLKPLEILTQIHIPATSDASPVSVQKMPKLKEQKDNAKDSGQCSIIISPQKLGRDFE